MTEDCHAIVAAPGFALGVRCTNEHITGILFLPPQAEVPATTPLAAEAARQLHAWLADHDHAFDLPLAAAGTAFQNRVWAQIRAIPRGATRRYGQLARTLGSAARAVGQACGANPYPVVVPCHRVVATGGPGGFAHARVGLLLDIKHWLLAHERWDSHDTAA